MITVHVDLQTAIDVGAVGPFVSMLKLTLLDTTEQFRTRHIHDVTADGDTYEADGLWLGVDPLRSDGRNVATSVRVLLNLASTAVVNSDYEGATAELRFGFLQPNPDKTNAGAVIGGSILWTSGPVNVGEDEETEGQLIRPLDILGPLWADQFEPTQHARTDEGQIDRFTDDRIFEQVNFLRRAEFKTGGKGVRQWG